jgi:hypothetical protein
VPRLTTDGTHPTNAGAATIAQWALNDPAFADVPKDGPPLLTSDDFDSYNLFASGRGCFTATSGTPGVAANLYSWNNHGGSLVDGAKKGRWQRWTRSAGAGPNNGNIGIPDFPVVPGHVYEFQGRIKSRFDSSQVGMFNGLMALVWNSSADQQVKFEWLVGTPGLDEEEGVFLYRTVAPEGAAKVLPIIQQSDTAVAPSVDAWVQMAQMTIRDVT